MRQRKTPAVTVLFLSCMLATASVQAQEERILTWSKGASQNGEPFDPLPVKRLQLRGGNRVDTIIINGNQYGWSGGALTKALIMAPDEYIARIAVYVDGRIHRLSFYTNKHPECGGKDASRCITSGTPSSGFSSLGGIYPYDKNADPAMKHSNIRVLSIAGRAHRSGLQQIEVKYISNYAPPIPLKSNVTAITSWKLGPRETQTYVSQKAMKMERVLNVIESTAKLEISSSAKATVFGSTDVSSSMTLNLETSSREEKERELRNELTKSVTDKQILRENDIWISRAKGDLYRDVSSGRMFFVPTGSHPGMTLDIYKIGRRLNGHYDLSLSLVDEIKRITGNDTASRKNEKDLYLFK